MSTMNRLANTKNPYQGEAKKVLCVCSAGLLRSPTLAWVLSNEPYGYNTRAAGINEEFALIPVDEVLVEWADEIMLVEWTILKRFEDKFKTDKPVRFLDIPDMFQFRDPKLIAIIKEQLVKEYAK